MGFSDEVVITAESGAGGNGCVSFRREKFLPKGGPDGGDGGNGGGVIASATLKLRNLAPYNSRKHLKAANGSPGKGKNRSGKKGADIILKVPLGTLIQDIDTGELLADLVSDRQEVQLITGGKGGKGNQHFATSTNRTPRFAESGHSGQIKRLRLSLKFLADIGLVGLPNAGKSTLLSRLTLARPKIDNYPFTTLIPNLGTIIFEENPPLIIADIPGLIEGASQGRGLGHRFLRHIERTKLIIYLLDITYQPGRDILEDFHTLNDEMMSYNPELMKKPQIVLINKMDLYGSEHRNLEQMQTAFKGIGLDTLPISALKGQGLKELKRVILQKQVKSRWDN